MEYVCVKTTHTYPASTSALNIYLKRLKEREEAREEAKMLFEEDPIKFPLSTLSGTEGNTNPNPAWDKPPPPPSSSLDDARDLEERLDPLDDKEAGLREMFTS